MSSFYQRQRRCSGILMKQGKPAGGKWSFDAANRKRAPKDINIPALKIAALSLPARRALDSVERQFSGNPGEIGRLIYPVTFESAECWLTDFLERRLARYGDYQDAMVTNEPFLFHSVLSPLINCGLLTPAQVLQRSLAWGRTHRVPLNSLEGFVRQILGWREFMRGVYAKLGQRQRTQNFWGNRRRIPSSFWRAETGILPLDVTISRVLNYSYCHHIERLMVLGNFMLLCEFDPDEVYRWFMELFVDAYDWVMVPNVYGMSQYADGGLMTTKPYISSSNYIRKMSDFALGPWVEIWDGLFWRFINKHKEFFASNPRLSVMALQLKRLEKAKLSLHLKRAEAFLEALDG